MEQPMLQSLLRPEAYAEDTRTVELRQTHISYLFFTDNHVYKVKKPVDLGFLNFSSIDRRRFYCHEEVRLNSRLSPEIYLGVEEVRQTPAGASFSGNGPVIDYAVKMRRLPEDRMLDRLIAEGGVTPDDIRRVARKVAACHAGAERSRTIDPFGSIDTINRNWEENFAQVVPFIGETIFEEDLQFLKRQTAQFMVENSGLFAQRISEGYIRDCDGDLHLENICLDENVWIFDCIEFNNRFRYCDTAADIAFLIMDLEFHDKSELAAEFLDEYCSVANDSGCRQLIGFYKSYRAFVRGKVASLQLPDSDIPQMQRDAARQRAMGYFRLARGYFLRRSMPQTMVIVGGLMGSGKSTIARILGRELGVPVLSSDRVRKELFEPGLSHGSGYGEGLYTPEADRATYAELIRRGAELLRSSESVIIDATFRRASDRFLFRKLADDENVRCLMVMADAPDDLIRIRLADRELRPDQFSDGRVALFDRHRDSFEHPDPDLEQFIVVQTAGDPWSAVDAVISAMGTNV